MPDILGGQLVAAVANVAFVEPSEKTGNNFRGLGDFWFGDDPNRANFLHPAYAYSKSLGYLIGVCECASLS